MPVFKSGKGLAPAWCELEYFDIVRLSSGESHAFERIGAKEKLIVGVGVCRLLANGCEHRLEKGGMVDLVSPGGSFKVVEVIEPATLIRMAGRWGDEVGGSGLFPVWNADKENPDNWGDAVPYRKLTAFDSHFHDCDEYWILFEGRGIAASEGRLYEVGPGDCVATGMGHHHDFPEVFEPVTAVFFETTMEGRKRPGHLWIHTHGVSEPKPERV